MTLVLVLVLAVLVLVLIGFVMGYNKLRSADVRVDEALGGIDVQLTRRASLIPSLVKTVQTFAAHERSSRARGGRAGCTDCGDGGQVDRATLSAEHDFDSAVGQVFALGRSIRN